MIIKWDKKAEAAYITLSEGKSVESRRVQMLSEKINLDYDAQNRIIGIEVLGVKTKPVFKGGIFSFFGN